MMVLEKTWVLDEWVGDLESGWVLIRVVGIDERGGMNAMLGHEGDRDGCKGWMNVGVVEKWHMLRWWMDGVLEWIGWVGGMDRKAGLGGMTG